MPGGTGHDGSAVVRTFLIADVRGYTRFTQTRGDEAAARLAGRFADVAQEVVSAAGGRVQELRGDEAMCVFTSPRQAIRAAVDLQKRFVEATLENPDLPLGVGIGIDAGEAVRVKGGYRGGALNLAARLCSLARAGEILASREAVHLAHEFDGVRYVERGRIAVKGIDTPPVVMRVVTDEESARNAQFRAALQAGNIDQQQRSRNRRRLFAVGAVAVAVVLADVGIVIARAGELHAIKAIGSDAVGVVNLGQSVLYDRIAVGGGAGALAADKRSVWVANVIDGTVSIINIKHPSVVNTVPVGDNPSGIAVGYGSLWVSNANDRSVSRVNENSKTVTARITVGNGPSAVAVGDGAVWVTNSLDGTVSVIDPRINKQVATVAVGGAPSAVIANQAVWVADSGSASVSRIDPAARQVSATVPVGNDPDALAVVRGQVWTANALDGTVSRIDPATDTVAATVTTGGEPTALAGSGNALWVADGVGDRATRVDVNSSRVAHVVHLGNAPQSAIIAGGRLWLSARGSGRTHRGGTLRLPLDAGWINSLDPATGFRPLGWQLESNVFDGLVTFARVGGPGGTLLVPDIAGALPTVTDAGRSYTFRLRNGIRYSNGRALLASDFVQAMLRQERIGSDSAGFYDAISGALECRTTGRCTTFTRVGLTADNATGSVRIQLVQADPELLYKLTLPFASFVAPGAPKKEAPLGALFGTGPYKFEPVRANGDVVLRRNPYFRQWSHIARPDGYPDVIDLKFTNPNTHDRDVVATSRGTFDVYPDLLNPDQVSALRTQHPTQLHPYALPEQRYFFLNVKTPPFNDKRVRVAVNLAFDRSAYVASFGGEQFGSPSCQILPPTVAGYVPYCPYTLHPNPSGNWTAPDVRRARELVRESGTAGMLVTIPYPVSRRSRQQPLIDALHVLGYSVRLKPFGTHDSGPGPYYDYVFDPANAAQIGEVGWEANYPAPSNFVEALLTCGAITPPPNQNTGNYCNRTVDARVSTALNLQASDPASASKLWSDLDHFITDDAAWVAVMNDRGWDLVSPRVGDYQHHPQWGLLLDQLWVQ